MSVTKKALFDGILRAKDISDTAMAVLVFGAKKSTKFVTPKMTIKATYQGKRDSRARRHTVLLTIGTPNFAEQQFIKKAVKAKEPFPVKRLQSKFPKKK